MARAPRVVVGLDPGLANVGLGAVRQVGQEAFLLGTSLIRSSSKERTGKRLERIFTGTHTFLEAHQPEALALEGQYFHRQHELSFKVGQAVGVCLLAAQQLEIEVFEYGPMQVKQALVGSGRADKAQVAFMVRGLLRLKGAPESHHVSDALALALTHLSTLRFEGQG